MALRKLFPLALAAVVGLTACADDPVQLQMREAPEASLSAAASGSASFNQVADRDSGGTYLVRFRGNGIPADFAGKVAALGGEVIFAHAGAGIAAVSDLSDAAADQLAASRSVAAVDADAYTVLEQPADEVVASAEGIPASPDAPAAAAFFGRQWNMKAIDAPAAWAAGALGSASVKVGVLDTGIDYLHPDLVGRVDLALSRSFLSAAEDARVPAGAHLVADLNYHGTHVASTIVSNGLIAAGVTSKITLVGLKVCAPGTAQNGYRGTCPTSGTLNAILYAADNGLDVINMSLGGAFQRRQASARGGDGPSFIATINQVMNYANRKGTTVVVSAGNSAMDLDHGLVPNSAGGTDHFPGLYASYCSAPTVICVSATGPTSAGLYATPAYPTLGEYLDIENIDAPASYTNYGRSAISVAAPGGNAISVWSACSGFTIHPNLAGCRSRYYEEATGRFSGSVVGLSGTSMSAPHTSAVAALIVGQAGRNPAQVQARLQQSADDLGQPGTDPYYGKGRINVAGAVGMK